MLIVGIISTELDQIMTMLDELTDEKESLLRKIEADKQEVCNFHSQSENESKSTFLIIFKKFKD